MRRSNIVILVLFIIFILTSLIYLHNINIEYMEINSDFSSREKYDSNNYDLQYHRTVDEIEASSNSGSYLIGQDGKLQYVSWTKMSPDITYYKPGTYTYGSKTWIPNYEESIILSSTKK